MYAIFLFPQYTKLYTTIGNKISFKSVFLFNKIKFGNKVTLWGLILSTKQSYFRYFDLMLFIRKKK